jgi:hypothetical protein
MAGQHLPDFLLIHIDPVKDGNKMAHVVLDQLIYPGSQYGNQIIFRDLVLNGQSPFLIQLVDNIRVIRKHSL